MCLRYRHTLLLEEGPELISLAHLFLGMAKQTALCANACSKLVAAFALAAMRSRRTCC